MGDDRLKLVEAVEEIAKTSVEGPRGLRAVPGMVPQTLREIDEAVRKCGMELKAP
jgi:hypothetical protein